jgi:hypothetical protein
MKDKIKQLLLILLGSILTVGAGITYMYAVGDAAPDIADEFRDKWVPVLMTTVASFGGVGAILTIIANKIITSKSSLDGATVTLTKNSQDSVTLLSAVKQLSEAIQKANSNFYTENKRENTELRDEIRTLSVKYDASQKDIVSMKLKIDGVLDIVNTAFQNDPTLVRTGVAEKIKAVYDDVI